MFQPNVAQMEGLNGLNQYQDIVNQNFVLCWKPWKDVTLCATFTCVIRIKVVRPNAKKVVINQPAQKD